MTNRELHDALKAELSIPYEELIIKHPTIADLGTEFVDYTEDGVFTLKYPLKDTQRNGYHLLQGGYISSFFDNNYGLFVYVAADASPFSTVNMTMNFHKAVLNEFADLHICILERSRAAFELCHQKYIIYQTAHFFCL